MSFTASSRLASPSNMAVTALRNVSHQRPGCPRYSGNVNPSSQVKYSSMRRAILAPAYPHHRSTPLFYTQSWASMKKNSSQRQHTTRSSYSSNPDSVTSTEAYKFQTQNYHSSGERGVSALHPIALSVPLDLRAHLMRHEVKSTNNNQKRRLNPPVDSQMKAVEEAERQKRTARNFIFASMMQPSTVSKHGQPSDMPEAANGGLLGEDLRLTLMLDKKTLSNQTKPSSPDPRVQHKMREIGLLLKKEQ